MSGIRPLTWLLLLFSTLIWSACSTTFHGSAHVDGPGECMDQCKAWKMELSGMVAMGEYTSGCICRVRGTSTVKVGSVDDFLEQGAVVGAAGAAAAVATRAKEQEAQQQGMMMSAQH